MRISYKELEQLRIDRREFAGVLRRLADLEDGPPMDYEGDCCLLCWEMIGTVFRPQLSATERAMKILAQHDRNCPWRQAVELREQGRI